MVGGFGEWKEGFDRDAFQREDGGQEGEMFIVQLHATFAKNPQNIWNISYLFEIVTLKFSDNRELTDQHGATIQYIAQ